MRISLDYLWQSPLSSCGGLAGEKRAVTGCLSVGIWKGFRLVDPISNPFQGLVFTAFHAALSHPVSRCWGRLGRKGGQLMDTDEHR